MTALQLQLENEELRRLLALKTKECEALQAKMGEQAIFIANHRKPFVGPVHEIVVFPTPPVSLL